WKDGWGCKSTGRKRGWSICGKLARAWTFCARHSGSTATGWAEKSETGILMPSYRPLARERTGLHEKIGLSRCLVPIPDLITELNGHLRGWAKYFGLGHPRKAKHN